MEILFNILVCLYYLKIIYSEMPSLEHILVGGVIVIFLMDIRGWDKIEYPSGQREYAFLDV